MGWLTLNCFIVLVLLAKFQAWIRDSMPSEGGAQTGRALRGRCLLRLNIVTNMGLAWFAMTKGFRKEYLEAISHCSDTWVFISSRTLIVLSCFKKLNRAFTVLERTSKCVNNSFLPVSHLCNHTHTHTHLKMQNSSWKENVFFKWINSTGMSVGRTTLTFFFFVFHI